MGRHSNNFIFETILVSKAEKQLVGEQIINYYKRHKSISFDKALEIQTIIKRPLNTIFVGTNQAVLIAVDEANKTINDIVTRHYEGVEKC